MLNRLFLVEYSNTCSMVIQVRLAMCFVCLRIRRQFIVDIIGIRYLLFHKADLFSNPHIVGRFQVYIRIHLQMKLSIVVDARSPFKISIVLDIHTRFWTSLEVDVYHISKVYQRMTEAVSLGDHSLLADHAISHPEHCFFFVGR